MSAGGIVTHVHLSGEHAFSKQAAPSLKIIAGYGVEGDAHAGKHVQHLSRVRANPAQPNLRQVHLIHTELFSEVAQKGFAVHPGDLGENITTIGLDLLALGRDTILHIGDEAALRVTGLRNPCAQIDAFAHGLLRELAVKTPNGLVRRAGIMCIALTTGVVRAGDQIQVEQPNGPYIPLEPV